MKISGIVIGLKGNKIEIKTPVKAKQMKDDKDEVVYDVYIPHPKDPSIMTLAWVYPTEKTIFHLQGDIQ